MCDGSSLSLSDDLWTCEVVVKGDGEKRNLLYKDKIKSLLQALALRRTSRLQERIMGVADRSVARGPKLEGPMQGRLRVRMNSTCIYLSGRRGEAWWGGGAILRSRLDVMHTQHSAVSFSSLMSITVGWNGK